MHGRAARRRAGVGETYETRLRTREEFDGITHVFRGDGLERAATLVADLEIGDPAARYRVTGSGWLRRHRLNSAFVDPQGSPEAPEIEWFSAYPTKTWPGQYAMLSRPVTGTEQIT